MSGEQRNPLSRDEKDLLRRMNGQGASVREMAARTGRSIVAVYGFLAREAAKELGLEEDDELALSAQECVSTWEDPLNEPPPADRDSPEWVRWKMRMNSIVRERNSTRRHEHERVAYEARRIAY